MYEKDMMQAMSGMLGNISEEERMRRIKSLQKNLDSEMKRRKITAEKIQKVVKNDSKYTVSHYIDHIRNLMKIGKDDSNTGH